MPRTAAGTRTAAGARTTAGTRQTVRNFGTCLTFNGSSAYVNSNYSTALPGSFSLSFWVKIPKGVSALAPEIIGSVSSGGTNELAIGINDGTASGKLWSYLAAGATIYITNAISTSADLRDGNWHHIVLTHTSGGALTQYVDGVSAGTTGSSLTSIPVPNIYIGARNNNGTADRFMNAKIDEVVLFSGYVLTASDITNINYNGVYPTASKTFWYKFDEGSGTSATDSSGNGNTGTITAATYSTDVFMVARTVAT